jgi:hypothetical protein
MNILTRGNQKQFSAARVNGTQHKMPICGQNIHIKIAKVFK